MVDIIHKIGIRAPLSQVYEAVATPEGVAGWWSRHTTGSAKVGGRTNVRFLGRDGKEIGQMDYELTRLDPDREVRWRFVAGPPEWIGSEATFELSRDGDMTILIFGHRNWKEAVEFTAHCSMKWAVFLLSLRD
ncbi:MAG TPA: SRPBCC domain-containing protein, partial [Gemmatimonadales bacterium]|nr:SRPBCC domain-containing protein [Gemmatimonadales bacterium]